MSCSKVEDWPSVSFDEAKCTLRKWREENVRRSEETVEIWEHVLSRWPNSLGDELWVVYEQVCIAAFDCARLDIAQECITALYNKFPDSRRVLKLQAMRLEAMCKFNEAKDCYDRLIKDDESNPVFRKRKVAIFKAQGKVLDAIRELNDYLKIFMNDSEAWMELVALYLGECDYAKASYCLEELILAHPRDHLYFQLFGEVKYTQGGRENVEMAKTYFTEAVKLNPDNVRALWGLYNSASQLFAKETGQKKNDLSNLLGFTRENLTRLYKKQKQTTENGATYEKQIEAIESLLRASANEFV